MWNPFFQVSIQIVLRSLTEIGFNEDHLVLRFLKCYRNNQWKNLYIGNITWREIDNGHSSKFLIHYYRSPIPKTDKWSQSGQTFFRQNSIAWIAEFLFPYTWNHAYYGINFSFTMNTKIHRAWSHWLPFRGPTLLGCIVALSVCKLYMRIFLMCVLLDIV